MKLKKKYRKYQLGIGEGIQIGMGALGLLTAPFRAKKEKKLQEEYNKKMVAADASLADSRTNKYYYGDRDSTIAQLGVTDKYGRTYIQDSNINPDNIPNTVWDTWSQNYDNLAKANAVTAEDESIKGKGKKADKVLKDSFNAFAKENFLKPLNLPSTAENFILDNAVKAPVNYLMGDGYGDQAKKWTQRAYQQFIPITNLPSFMKSASDYGEGKEHLSNVLSNALYSSPFGKTLNTINAYRFPTQIVAEEAGLIPEGYGSLLENTPKNIEGLVNTLGRNLGGITTAGKVVRDGLIKEGKLQQGTKLSSGGKLIGGNYHNQGGTKVNLGNETVEMEKGEVVSKTPQGMTVFSNVLPNKDKNSFAKKAKELERLKGKLEKQENSEAQNGIDLVNLALEDLGNKQEEFKQAMNLQDQEYIPELNYSNDQNNDGINDAIMQKGRKYKKYAFGDVLNNNAGIIGGGMNMLSNMIAPSSQQIQQLQNQVDNFQNPHAAQIAQNYATMQKGKKFANLLGVDSTNLDKKQQREANRLAKRLIKDQNKGKRIKDNILNDAYAKALSSGNIDRAFDVYYDNTQRTWGAGNQVNALNAESFTPQLNYNDGEKVMQMGIAQNINDYTTGLKDSSKSAMMFPFQKGSKNVMTMKGITEPILMTDELGTQIAYPGNDYNTQGSVYEQRMQVGLNIPDLSQLMGNRKQVEIEQKPYMQTTNVNLGTPGTNNKAPNLPGGRGNLTTQTPEQYMQSLLDVGYTPEQVQQQLNGGGTMLGENYWKPYADMYGKRYGTPGNPTTKDVSLSPIVGNLEPKGINAPYQPSLDSPNIPQTVPTPDNPNGRKKIGDLLKDPKTSNILNSIGQNADLIAPFFLNDKKPPAKGTTAYYTPELLQPNLQPYMDAGTSAMRQLNRFGGNAGTKNALIASTAMQRAANTANEMNRVDNANNQIINDAALKNIGLQEQNNLTNYNNQANRILFENGRNAKRQQWAANLAARLQTKQRDKNAEALDQTQRDLYRQIYPNMPNVLQYGFTTKKKTKKKVSGRGNKY